MCFGIGYVNVESLISAFLEAFERLSATIVLALILFLIKFIFNRDASKVLDGFPFDIFGRVLESKSRLELVNWSRVVSFTPILMGEV